MAHNSSVADKAGATDDTDTAVADGIAYVIVILLEMALMIMFIITLLLLMRLMLLMQISMLLMLMILLYSNIS